LWCEFGLPGKTKLIAEIFKHFHFHLGKKKRSAFSAALKEAALCKYIEICVLLKLLAQPQLTACLYLAGKMGVSKHCMSGYRTWWQNLITLMGAANNTINVCIAYIIHSKLTLL
jgi:hypothetical protein